MSCRQPIAFILLLCWVLTAQAHRQHISWTSITWNERTSSVEIVHRFHEHDVQNYLSRAVGKAVSVADLRGRAEFAVYLADHFKIKVKPHAVAPVELLGAELESQYVMVYQELVLRDPPTELEVYAQVLMDRFPDQVNMVNIDIKGIKQTLQFSRGDASKQYNALLLR